MNITLRRNWNELKAKLDEHGITTLYHFTDRRNLASIIENRGLYSWQDCLKNGIVVERPGGNDVSHSLDVHKHLENYVRLSFVKNHPMMYIAQEDERGLQPVVLEISTDVIKWVGTKFSDRNATKNDVNVRSDLSLIHFDILKHNAVYDIEDEEQQQFYQAEILVENCVPICFIKNIKDLAPDLVNQWDDLSPEAKFATYKRVADYGNAYANLSVAKCFHKGTGTDVDLPKAEEYYIKYSTCGAPAGYRLASNIYLSKEDDNSYAHAMRLLELGAKMPDGVRCTFKIARLKLTSEPDVLLVPSLLETLKNNASYHKDDIFFMYRLFHSGLKNNEGLVLVEKDKELALTYLQQAADMKHSKAISLLAQSFRANKDYKNAYIWYLKAAELGDKDAFFYAAYYSKDIDHNYEQAIRWYQKSVDAGSSAAMNNLAVMYENGQGVEANESKAFELYKMAVENGNSNLACNNLANCYENGIGTEIDLLKSFQCRLKAAKNGNVSAIRWLIEAYKSGDVIETDIEESFFWMEVLAQNDGVKPDEVYTLSQYFKGKDEFKYQKYIEKAASLNHRGALIELDRISDLELFPYGEELWESENEKDGVLYSKDGVYVYTCAYDIEQAFVEEGTLIVASECFSGLDDLKEVSLPKSIKIIGERAFAKCPHLFSIRNRSPFFTTMNGFLLSSDLKRLITYFGNDENVYVPQGVETIDEAAFAEKEIHLVVLPNSVKSIGIAAFYNCEKLEKIDIPSSIKEVGEFAFEGCKSLETITLPDIMSVPNGCFRESGLKKIQLPETIQSIGAYAFYGCSSLEDVVFNEGLVRIDSLAFKDCDNLNHVILPTSLISIGELAFTMGKEMSVVNNEKIF